ncbi:MAG: septum formation initiator family protein [Bacilli bacterium]|jgi:cell division protein DivIC|nr:septum formation initiator family protein [Mollicutes bacterium]
MSNKASKTTKRRLRLFTIITLIVFVLFVSNVASLYIQIQNSNQKETELVVELNTLKDKTIYLQNEVKKLSDPDYVAKYAREKYLYSKDGEYTIKLP